jgi:hypothetical protein
MPADHSVGKAGDSTFAGRLWQHSRAEARRRLSLGVGSIASRRMDSFSALAWDGFHPAAGIVGVAVMFL